MDGTFPHYSCTADGQTGYAGSATSSMGSITKAVPACSPKTDNAGDVPPPHEPRNALGIAALKQADVLHMFFLKGIPDTTCTWVQMSCKADKGYDC